ncbi:sushi domain-containing protein 3-like [Onychostruthus taczanowskii]|uniref:sushi domain-containing protein 3-like n=1 Tax=Onychostruthus taczanowskii TaxID=356909 RepID=UPI001B800B83|nr:sushi domain-containing protein 3-like [Onychostruthus taczanowskii]
MDQLSAQVPCTALPPPRYGYYYVDRGSGVSLGSVLVYWCQEGYQLVGSERLACLRQDSTSSWSHAPPQCQAAPQPSGTGSRIAVAASLLSGAVILALHPVRLLRPVLLARQGEEEPRGVSMEVGQQQQRSKVRGRRRDPSTAERGRNAFGRLKYYHRRDYHLSAVSSSVFPGALAGCNNLAFQSSPAQQPKVPVERWRCESQALLQPGLPAGPAPGSGLPGHLPSAPGRPRLPLGPAATQALQQVWKTGVRI